MSYTEEEAKTKWCPHTRVVWTSGNGPANRDMETKAEWPDTFPDFAKQTSCIGSKCMAWRWSEAKRTKAFVEAVQQRIKEKSTKDKPYSHNKAIAEVYAEIGDKLVHSEGYCGLAGPAS